MTCEEEERQRKTEGGIESCCVRFGSRDEAEEEEEEDEEEEGEGFSVCPLTSRPRLEVWQARMKTRKWEGGRKGGSRSGRWTKNKEGSIEREKKGREGDGQAEMKGEKE